MMRPTTGVVVLLMLGLSACSTAGPTVEHGQYDNSARWAAQGSWTDSCCCDVSCPCLFGSAPSLGYCEGASLIHLQKAHYEGVNLDGISVLVVYRSKEWVKYIVSEKATQAQTDAVVKLVPNYIKFLNVEKVVDVRNAPITLERGDDKIRFSAEGTVVEMSAVKGKNGKAVKFQNFPFDGFPAPPFVDHTQYKSNLLKHEDQDDTFEHKGTNAYTAQLATVSSSGN